MTGASKPSVVVTGGSGALGSRLVHVLGAFNYIGVDIVPPRVSISTRFERVDLSRESACQQLVQTLKDSRARAVIHLAFGRETAPASEHDQLWQVNVSGTARVMEAVTEVNRSGGHVDTFLFLSSALVYGAETFGPVKEEHPLGANSFLAAVHKQEADNVVRFRSTTLGRCSTYILRPCSFAGPGVRNVLLDALRGNPPMKPGEHAPKSGKRAPFLIAEKRGLENRLQFVHVDDVARLIAHILQKGAAGENKQTILNIAGRGEPLTVEQAAIIADARLKKVPGRWAMKMALEFMWEHRKSTVPPEALPYLAGSFTVNSSRLKQFLGESYNNVIRYNMADALKESFQAEAELHASAAPR